MPRFADRLQHIEPFHVMELLARARALEADGRSIVHMEIGEPDFPTARAIVQAGIRALNAGRTHYTPALGLPELRRRIAGHYPEPARPEAERVAVTPGASGALQLIFAALLNPGDQVLMADPGYPCNRHFVRLFEGEPVAVPVGPETRFQLSARLVRRHWQPRTVAVLLATPSNPTGTLIEDGELAQIVHTVQELGGVVIVDEIYHGLIYGTEARSALHHSDRLFVVNSFSKYFGMTGWRVGWLVAPRDWVSAIDKLAQNLFIAAPTVAQYAALAALEPETDRELQRRRRVFQARRDYLLPALRELGFRIPVAPDGAFYLYADCSRFTEDSFRFSLELLERAGVAVTPGLDFGHHQARRYLRFSYAAELGKLEQGVERLREYLA